MYKKECKWCDKLITSEKQQGFASHVAVCEMNPNKKENKNKGKFLVERIKLTKICPKCKNEFQIEATESEIKRNKVKNYCSSKCGNSHSKTYEQKKKISEINKNSEKVKLANKIIGENRKGKIGKSNKEGYKFICKYCGKNGENKRWKRDSKYHPECCKKCSGGIREGSSRGKSGWYKGFWCDSSYELAFLIYHLENGTEIIRNKKGFKYIHNGETHLFYPDFIINGNYYEIKNFKSEITDAKLSYFPHKITIYYKDTIKPFLDYSIQKYGKNFIKLYEI